MKNIFLARYHTAGEVRECEVCCCYRCGKGGILKLASREKIDPALKGFAGLEGE
jgi:hypothetical protein